MHGFLADRGLECGEVYGAPLVSALRPPIVGDLFLVGDAAGHCLPTMAEGIRPALFFGTHLGRLLSAVLEGQMELEEAKAAYRGLVEERRWAYSVMGNFQRLITTWPTLFTEAVALLIKGSTIHRQVLQRWERGMMLDPLSTASIVCRRVAEPTLAPANTGNHIRAVSGQSHAK